MKVYETLDQFSEIKKPAFLTIGNFDGVHLGHQALLQSLAANAKKENLPSAVITFSNHPSQILRPNHPILLLTSKKQKLDLFKKIGIDHTFIIPFTAHFAQQSAEIFLRKIHSLSPFRHLILGTNAKLGNDQQGDTPLLHSLAWQLHFMLSFLPLEAEKKEVITSSRIRTCLQNAEIEKAASMLGRKFSILGTVLHGKGKGKKLGYPTLNLSLETLQAPPCGVYAVTVIYNNRKYPAIANLGIAPTIRTDHIPLLEVHLLDQDMNLYDESIEVVFEAFFRPERTFTSEEALKAQIAKDIQQAKEFHKLHANPGFKE